MSTRSGACVWWSNARDRADRGGLPRRGVTYRITLVPAVAIGRSGGWPRSSRRRGRRGGLHVRNLVWAVCGRLRTGKPGQLGLLSGELRWAYPYARIVSMLSEENAGRTQLEVGLDGLPPPPRGSGKSPGNSQGFCRVPRFAALDLGASRNLSTNGVSILHASRCGGPLGVVSAAATHLHNLRGRRVHVR